MATAEVIGSLWDFGAVIMNAYQPQIVFTPSGPGVNGQEIYVTRPIKVTPFPSGGFRVDLEVNGDLSPSTWYMVRIDWLDSGGNYVSSDYFDWKLVVPPAGGSLGSLLKSPSNPAAAWVGESSPSNTTPGTWWLVPSTGNLYEWS